MHQEEKAELTKYVVLFISFDIVNSCEFKNIEHNYWPQALKEIFDEIVTGVKKDISKARVWRVIGDEMIFCVTIRHTDELNDYVKKVFEIMTDINEKILYNDFQFAKYYKAEISLQCGAWMALINDTSESKNMERYDNYLEFYSTNERNFVLSFQGNDIDSGFRMKSKTRSGKLLVSFELALFLSRKSNDLKRLHLFKYEPLKGIWNGKPYPIICYQHEKMGEFEDSFTYYELMNDVDVKNYLESKNDIGINKNLYDIRFALEKILKDLKIENKIASLEKYIQKGKKDAGADRKHGELQLHCPAVCYDERKQKILIMKRHKDRDYQGGKWEFGAAKASVECSVQKQIEKEYLEKYNLHISVEMDANRNDSPIPLTTYTIQYGDNARNDFGVIFLARLNKSDDKVLKNNHSEIRWIGADEVESIDEGDAVDNFKDTINKAFNYFKEKEDE